MSFEPLKPRTGNTFTLIWPFKFDGETYETLTMRRPTQSDLVALADGNGGAGARNTKFWANLAQVPTAVIDSLDPEDSDQISAWLEPILDPKGRQSKAAGS